MAIHFREPIANQPLLGPMDQDILTVTLTSLPVFVTMPILLVANLCHTGITGFLLLHFMGGVSSQTLATFKCAAETFLNVCQGL
jgi:hypothetical protein